MEKSIIEPQLATEFKGHEGAIYTLEQGREDHLFYSGSFDHLVVEWDLRAQTNRAIAKLPDKAFALKLLVSHNLLIVGTFSGGLHVIDLNANKEIKFLKLHETIIFDIQVDWNGNLIVLSADGSFSVWSIENLALIKHVKLGAFKLRQVTFIPSSKQAIIGCEDGAIRIIDSEYGVVDTRQIHQPNFSVNAVAILPGQILLTGSRDAHLKAFDLNNELKELNDIPAHNYAIYGIVIDEERNIFATASRDKTIKIWCSTTRELLKRIDKRSNEFPEGHLQSVNKIMWSRTGQLISTGDDRSIKVWNIDKV